MPGLIKPQADAAQLRNLVGIVAASENLVLMKSTSANLAVVLGLLVACAFSFRQSTFDPANTQTDSPSPLRAPSAHSEWSVTVRHFRARGSSDEGSDGYTVAYDGTVETDSYRQWRSGPQIHHTQIRVSHPEVLPEVESALLALADSKAGQSSLDNLEYRYAVGGRTGVASFNQDTSKPIPGPAGRLQDALDRALRSRALPQGVHAGRWLTLFQTADPIVTYQLGWSWREYWLNSQGEFTVRYHRGNSDLQGNWEQRLANLGPAQRQKLVMALKVAESPSEPSQIRQWPILLSVQQSGKSRTFASLDGTFRGQAATLLAAWNEASGSPLLGRPWMANPKP